MQPKDIVTAMEQSTIHDEQSQKRAILIRRGQVSNHASPTDSPVGSPPKSAE